ncbi:MAG: LCP family protein [Patescibacteria group bacterium]|nr:LCP family protein [Patescibacteria group bacterium]
MTLKKFVRKNRLILAILFFVTVGISATLTYFYFPIEKQVVEPTKLSNQDKTKEIFNRDLINERIEDLKSLNILLLGYGGAGHQGGYLADVIQIVNIDFENDLINFISIPRDLWITLPNKKQAKINQALTLGNDQSQLILSGGKVAKQMAEIVSGIDVDYFIAIDFVGFKRTIGETLEGITVDVPETLNDPWYPITGEELNPCGMTPEEVAELTNNYSGFELERQFECRYEHLQYKKGLVEMEGGDALKYVRSRHGSTAGDFSRSQRQKTVLLAIKNKLFDLESLGKIPEFFKLATNNVCTDFDLEILQYLAPALHQTSNYQNQSIILSTENTLKSSKSNGGQFILIPKAGLDQWQDTYQFIEREKQRKTE